MPAFICKRPTNNTTQPSCPTTHWHISPDWLFSVLFFPFVDFCTLLVYTSNLALLNPSEVRCCAFGWGWPGHVDGDGGSKPSVFILTFKCNDYSSYIIHRNVSVALDPEEVAICHGMHWSLKQTSISDQSNHIYLLFLMYRSYIGFRLYPWVSFISFDGLNTFNTELKKIF